MAYEILSESYGARLPKITATADSTDDLTTMGTNYAEGSTCVIGDKTYALDKVQGWIEPGSGGGGGGGSLVFISGAWDESDTRFVLNKTWSELVSLFTGGNIILLLISESDAGSVGIMTSYLNIDSDYSVTFLTADSSSPSATTYTCGAADEYPLMEDRSE